MDVSLPATADKSAVFSAVKEHLGSVSLTIAAIDDSRPWGGFFCIDESEAAKFAEIYFPGLEVAGLTKGLKLSPKLLIVAPGARLSWQFHHRRQELWRNTGEDVGYITSNDDTQGPVQTLHNGEHVQFGVEVRHRLIGLDNWGVVAEFWQHVDPANPSNEDDIIRVEDDFGR